MNRDDIRDEPYRAIREEYIEKVRDDEHEDRLRHDDGVEEDIFKCKLCGGQMVRVRGGDVGLACVNKNCKNSLRESRIIK